MKKRLSKKAIAGIALLGTAALTGSVFAGWLIVDSNASGKGDGNVIVYEVTDKSLSVNDVKFKYGENDLREKGNVVFGKPKDSSKIDSSSIWLGFEDSGDQAMQTESFPIAFTFNVITGKDVAKAPKVTAKFEVKGTGNTYADCKTKGYIKGPSEGDIAVTVPSAPTDAQNNKKQYSCSVSLDFGWGEHFGGENPYLYYNSKDRNSAVSDSVSFEDDLVASFGALSKLSGVEYSITIEATANND